MMRCRLVKDFDPGNVTVAATGLVLDGAGQASPGGGVDGTNRDLFRGLGRCRLLPRYPVCADSVVVVALDVGIFWQAATL